MASEDEVRQVRLNTNELTNDVYDDDTISAYIAASSVSGASGKIWEEKAARFSELVDITEGSSSQAMSQLYKNASEQASFYAKKQLEEANLVGPTQRTVIHQIERT